MPLVARDDDLSADANIHPTARTTRVQQLTQLQQRQGNRAVQRLLQRQDRPAAAAAPAAAAPTTEANPDDIWREIEPQARTELLIKLQEIGRQAAEQTRRQIEEFFSPYEDSLQSDQTFAQIAAVGPWAAAGAAGAAGPIAGGLAGGAAQGMSVAFSQILNTNQVSVAKERARSSLADSVGSQITSSSDLYNSFEADALTELETEFQASWARLTPDQRQLGFARQLYVTWYRGLARTKYGVESAGGQAALNSIRGQSSAALARLRPALDALQESQRNRRVGIGAAGGVMGGAVAGAAIGAGLGALGFGVGAVPGAIVGGIIGGIGGAIGGYLW
jgi:hypothetical protein